MKKLLIIAVSAIALSGCLAHNNQGAGTVAGGLVGGVVGNQFGSGSGKTLATALGAVIGAMSGSNVGQHMDQPHNTGSGTVVYRNVGPCGNIRNDGVRSSCQRGLADRKREAQRRAERRAYQCSRYRKCY